MPEMITNTHVYRPDPDRFGAMHCNLCGATDVQILRGDVPLACPEHELRLRQQSEPQTRYCRDCRHVVAPVVRHGQTRGLAIDYKCNRPSGSVSLVTGEAEPLNESCVPERSANFAPDSIICGREGRFFEPRPPLPEIPPEPVVIRQWDAPIPAPPMMTRAELGSLGQADEAILRGGVLSSVNELVAAQERAAQQARDIVNVPDEYVLNIGRRESVPTPQRGRRARAPQTFDGPENEDL